MCASPVSAAKRSRQRVKREGRSDPYVSVLATLGYYGGHEQGCNIEEAKSEYARLRVIPVPRH